MPKFDEEIVNLASGQDQPKSDTPAVEPDAPQQAPEVTLEARPERTTDVPIVKETKTAAELAQMIEADLAKHPQPGGGLHPEAVRVCAIAAGCVEKRGGLRNDGDGGEVLVTMARDA